MVHCKLKLQNSRALALTTLRILKIKFPEKLSPSSKSFPAICSFLSTKPVASTQYNQFQMSPTSNQMLIFQTRTRNTRKMANRLILERSRRTPVEEWVENESLAAPHHVNINKCLMAFKANSLVVQLESHSCRCSSTLWSHSGSRIQ